MDPRFAHMSFVSCNTKALVVDVLRKELANTPPGVTDTATAYGAAGLYAVCFISRSLIGLCRLTFPLRFRLKVLIGSINKWRSEFHLFDCIYFTLRSGSPVAIFIFIRASFTDNIC